MTEDKHIHKRHNKTLLLYHIVFPVKYRQAALRPDVEQTLKALCLGIAERYDIYFVEIGS
jgi:REP element-mobilizing transposase RayT